MSVIEFLREQRDRARRVYNQARQGVQRSLPTPTNIRQNFNVAREIPQRIQQYSQRPQIQQFVRQNPNPISLIRNQVVQPLQRLNTQTTQRYPTLGRAVNLINRLPTTPTPSRVIPQLQSFPRAAAAIGGTILHPNRAVTQAPTNRFERALIGNEPVRNYKAFEEAHLPATQNIVKNPLLAKAGLMGTFALGTVGQFTGFGAGKSQLAKTLTKVDDIAKVRQLTKGLNLGEDVLGKITKSKSAKEIGGWLDTAKLPQGAGKVGGVETNPNHIPPEFVGIRENTNKKGIIQDILFDKRTGKDVAPIATQSAKEQLLREGYQPSTFSSPKVEGGAKTVVPTLKTPTAVGTVKPSQTNLIQEPSSFVPSVAKERGFVKTVRESPKTAPEVAQKVEGQYIPRSTDALSIQAKELIKRDINQAKDLALSGSNDDAVATATELIDHYQRLGDFDSAVDVANKVAPKLTELGRAVQAASIYDRISPAGIVRYATREINKVNLSNPRLNLKLLPEQAKKLHSMASDIQKMADGTEKAMATQKLLDEVAGLLPTPAHKKIIALWKAGLLTGLKTSGVNIISNLTHGIMEVAKDLPAVVVDSVASLFTKQRTKTITLKGSGKGVIEGFANGWRYLKTGFDPRNAGIKYDYHKVNFGKSKIGRMLQTYEDGVFRLMGSEDQPFYYGAKARSIYDQAIAQGKNSGLKGSQLKSFVDNLVQNPTDDILKNAVSDAEIAVFQNRTKLGEAASAIQKVGQGAGEAIVPFGRTPASVATQLVNYSPYGIVKTVIENIGKGRFDQRQFSQAMGRGVVGTGLFAIGSALMAKGLMTLKTPTSERERSQWELEGRQANSIKIGNQWHRAGALGPIGLSMIIGGYYQNALQKTGSPMNALATAVSGLGPAVVDQSFLKGASGWLQAVNDPLNKWELLLSNTAGSVIPTIVGDVARAMDQFQRETYQKGQGIKNIVPAIKSRIPLMRETLPTKIDVLGRQLERETGALNSMVNPFRPTTIKTSPMTQELRRLMDQGVAVTPTELDRTFKIGDKQISLSPEQLNLHKQFTGQEVERIWSGVMSNRDYQNLSDEEKKNKLQKYIDDIRPVTKLQIANYYKLASPDEIKQGYDKLTKAQKAYFDTGDMTIQLTEQPKKPKTTKVSTKKSSGGRKKTGLSNTEIKAMESKKRTLIKQLAPQAPTLKTTGIKLSGGNSNAGQTASIKLAKLKLTGGQPKGRIKLKTKRRGSPNRDLWGR